MSIYEIRQSIVGPRSNLREIMEEKKISIANLMKTTKLSKRTIQNARNEIKNCKLETLAIIAQGLDVKIKDLFDED